MPNSAQLLLDYALAQAAAESYLSEVATYGLRAVLRAGSNNLDALGEAAASSRVIDHLLRPPRQHASEAMHGR
jgi:hypothetical protein